MRYVKTALVLGTVALAAAVSAQPGDKPAKDAWKQAQPVGKALSCLPLQSIRNTRVRDDQTIDFYTNGSKVYRNTLPQSCPQLGFEERFTYTTSQSALCSTDIVTVLISPGVSRGASCGLGQFQELSGAPK